MGLKGNKNIPSAGDLNLAPIMNLMVTLIPMLLLSASFLEVVLLDTSLPIFAEQEQQQQVEQEADKPKLGLTVAISEEGFVLGGQGGLLNVFEGTSLIPLLSNNSYDFSSLSEKLFQIKQNFPDEWSIIIIPESNTPYGDIIATMDAVREFISIDEYGAFNKKMMFPNIVIGGGVL